MGSNFRGIAICAWVGILLVTGPESHSATSPSSPTRSPTKPADLVNPCPRPQPGTNISQPTDLFSHDGLLEVTLNYSTIADISNGFSTNNALQLFCYSTPDGKQSPTLHVWPGDHLVIHLKNNIPDGTLILQPDGTINHNQAPGTDNTSESGMMIDQPCLDSIKQAASTNIHFHGLNLPATCGQDDVLHTVVNPGHTFTYDVRIPRDHPPGLYWYHPHIHGINEGVANKLAEIYCKDENIDGLQIDLEPVAHPYVENFTLLLKQLSSQLLSSKNNCSNPRHPEGRSLGAFMFAKAATHEIFQALGPNGYVIASGYDLHSGPAGIVISPTEFSERLREELKLITARSEEAKGFFAVGIPASATAHEFTHHIPEIGEPVTGYPIYSSSEPSYLKLALEITHELLNGNSQWLGTAVWGFSPGTPGRTVPYGSKNYFFPPTPFETKGIFEYLQTNL